MSQSAIEAILGADALCRFRPAGGFKQEDAYPRASYQVINGGSVSQNFTTLGGLHSVTVQITCTDKGHGSYQDAADLAQLFIGTESSSALGAYAGGTLGGIVVRSIELVPESWNEISTPPDDASDDWIHEVTFDLLVMFDR